MVMAKTVGVGLEVVPVGMPSISPVALPAPMTAAERVGLSLNVLNALANVYTRVSTGQVSPDRPPSPTTNLGISKFAEPGSVGYYAMIAGGMALVFVAGMWILKR